MNISNNGSRIIQIKTFDDLVSVINTHMNECADMNDNKIQIIGEAVRKAVINSRNAKIFGVLAVSAVIYSLIECKRHEEKIQNLQERIEALEGEEGK